MVNRKFSTGLAGKMWHFLVGLRYCMDTRYYELSDRLIMYSFQSQRFIVNILLQITDCKMIEYYPLYGFRENNEQNNIIK